MVKKVSMILCLGLAASVAALASTTCINLSNSTTVTPATCTWTTSTGAVLTFYNFTLINNNGSGSVTTTASNWDVAFSDLGTGFRLSLNPTGSPITANSLIAGTGGVYQFFWSYRVVVTSLGAGGSGQINNIGASLTSSNVVANGEVQFVKSYAGGNVSLVNQLGSNTLTGSSTGGLPSSGPITIFDSVNVNGGNNGASTATLNSFYNQINVTGVIPEPVTVSLMGFGLLGIGLARRRMRKN